MIRHRHHLCLDDGADVARGVRWIEIETANAWRGYVRRDLRLEPRQHQRAVVARRRLGERAREARPVEPVLVADPLAGQRTVAEADEAHVAAGRRAKHVRRIDAAASA